MAKSFFIFFSTASTQHEKLGRMRILFPIEQIGCDKVVDVLMCSESPDVNKVILFWETVGCKYLAHDFGFKRNSIDRIEIGIDSTHFFRRYPKCIDDFFIGVFRRRLSICQYVFERGRDSTRTRSAGESISLEKDALRHHVSRRQRDWRGRARKKERDEV